MGIPGFLSKVQPYATSLEFQIVELADDDEAPKQFIIDGPALAHFIFSQEILASGAPNTFASTLSYRAIGKATVEWLDMLKAYNVDVKAIYFDGGLPVPKRKERLERLENSLQRLVSFKAKQNTHLRAWSQGTFPALPFLVPAVIEYLLHSSYSDVVSLVDGEADALCAELAYSTGGIVITSDSDLVVHDLRDGSVIYLSDLGVHLPKLEPGPTFSVPCFRPNSIARSLGVQSMAQLAFQYTLDYHKTLRQCAGAVPERDSVKDGFTEFAQPYRYSGLTAEFTESFVTRHVIDDMDDLKRMPIDPRISEYLLHAGIFPSNRHSFSEITSSQTSCRIYMPVLLDDPDKPSPWKAGQHFRQLGYAIIRLAGTPGGTREFSRDAHQICGTYIESLSQSEIVNYCDSFVENAIHIEGLYSTHTLDKKWRMFALKYVLETRKLQERKLPPKRDIIDMLKAQPRGVDWDFIQFSAEHQATLYSLRILDQCLHVYQSMSPRVSEVKEDCEAAISRLDKIIDTEVFPEIQDLLPGVEQPGEWNSSWDEDVKTLLHDGPARRFSGNISTSSATPNPTRYSTAKSKKRHRKRSRVG